jgi:hypothetical protein
MASKTTAVTALQYPRCVHCQRLILEPAARGLCRNCYASPARSSYDSSGRRVAPVPPGGLACHDGEDDGPFVRGPARHVTAAEQRSPLDPQAQRQADDEALLAGVLEVTRERINVTDDGTPASSVTAAARRAGLATAHRANAAAARLVAAGRARSVRVWLNPHGTPAPGVGRTAAGLVAVG